MTNSPNISRTLDAHRGDGLTIRLLWTPARPRRARRKTVPPVDHWPKSPLGPTGGAGFVARPRWAP